ncbi:cytosolic phospholipase A2-like isoform X3 [Mytilus edulis]|uniref:cytosolic phospholipase A2-like isoform X3 n=1 Tax=Mytilus edulis TaxID=6550 RepID=UPI0039F04814
MAQRSFSSSACQTKSLQRRPSKLRLSYCKPKSEDELDSHSKPHSDKSDRLRRTQSLKLNRKPSRRSKVLYQAKGKSMIKVTLSPVTPPEDKYTDIELHHEGTKGEPCTPKRHDKSFKFYVNQCNLQYCIPADIIFKSGIKEVERVAVFSLLDIDNPKTIACETVDLRASSPELKFSDLRIFDNSKGFLCDQEQQFQEKRKLNIHTALQKLLMTSLEENDVPNIALMGSGGGYRAMVAMSGVIHALYDTKVLDSILYTAVLSGSSWFIATLYSHPDWPNIHPNHIQKQLKRDISTYPYMKIFSNGLDAAFKYCKSLWTGQSWDLTTGAFAPLLGDVLIPDRTKCRWSEQRDKLSEGTVPLPLLSAIHAKNEVNANEFHGICGSAFTLTYEEYSNKFDVLDGPQRKDDGVLESGCDAHRLCEDFTPVKELDGCDDVFDGGEKEQSITSKLSNEEIEDLFKKVCQIRKENGRIFEAERTLNERDVGDNFKEGKEGADEVDGLEQFMNSRRYRAAMVNNFLRKVSFDDTDSCHKQRETNPLFENYLKNDTEELCLIDAGLAFNSPYPLLFKPGRDVDLILSFDFTDRKKDSNDPFESLLKAEDWARQHEIKFPTINVDNYEGKNEELYIFEDDNDPHCPIIMHFVLVNKDFRTYTKPGVKRKQDEKEFANFTVYDHKTFNCTNFQYSEENFDRLSQLSEFIVLNNIVQIKDCITKSIQNKQKRKRQRHISSPV